MGEAARRARLEAGGKGAEKMTDRHKYTGTDKHRDRQTCRDKRHAIKSFPK